MNTRDTQAPRDFESLRLSSIAPNVLRELSGIYPTFVSAFKELVSNAYDADATEVLVRFSPDLSIITVEDNGSGMTPFEFQDRYIRIGGSLQRRDKNLTPRGRQPIGRKGIGFLAVARYCRSVEIRSHASRKTALTQNVLVESSRLPCLKGALAEALAPFTTVQAVRYGGGELADTQYRRKGLAIELSEGAWRRLKGKTLTIKYMVDCNPVELEATIDYEYLFSLADDSDLGSIDDFCRARIISSAQDKTSWSEGNPRPSFTEVTLHLRKFVQEELGDAQRAGWVRNIESASGRDRFVWHLSRSVPTSYKLISEELEECGLELLTVPVSPVPFAVNVIRSDDTAVELRRPLLGKMDISNVVVKRAISFESKSLRAQGYLLGFSKPVFPAELRGIAVRVRGVQIGEPDFLGVEDDIPAKYRPLLNQLMGEVIVAEGLDAIEAIAPGRAAFYADDVQFQALRRHLVGNGTVEQGVLGQVLRELRKRHDIENSAERIVQEARRRRRAFLNVSRAITTLSIASHYGHALQRLFTRSDVEANGLRQAPIYEVQIPGRIGDYLLELTDLAKGDYRIEIESKVVQLSPDARTWDQPLYILGREFEVSLRNGRPDDPVCEIDFSANVIYLNWMHPTRSEMGDALFVKSALFWRIAYLASNGNVDLMMNLAHRLLSLSA